MADERPRSAVPDRGIDGLTALARDWAIAVINTSHSPASRTEVELTLREVAAQLIKLLQADPFDPQPAGEHGSRLVAENFNTSSALSQTLRLLNTREARFHAVFQSTAVGIAIADLTGRIELTNPALSVILGVPQEHLIGRALPELCAVEDLPKVATGFGEVVHGSRSQYVSDVSFADGDDEPVWTRLSVTLVETEYGRPTHAVAMIEDISDLHLLRHDQLVHALHDQLTGLPNRAKFMSTLDEALRNARQDDHIALCYVDLDGFKVINDGVGHDFGDKLLRRVANTLRAAFPEPNATVARVGGDGFGVLLTGKRGGAEFSERISEVLRQLNEPIFVDNETGVGVSASVGIVERPAFGLTAGELVQAAELATHRAKANGKAQWELYDPELDRRDRDRFRLAAAIPGALETGEFATTFQPVARMTDRSLVALHGSIRWNHPKLGELRPKDFFALAEETGFIVPLGRWVLEETGRRMAAWYREHGDAMPLVLLSLTERMAQEQDLIKILREIIEDTGLPVHKFRLSIPSDVVVDRYGETLDNLTFFDAIGVKVIVSGYGNGNVGLADLRQLPVSGVSTSAKATRAVVAGEADSAFEHSLAHLVKLTDELRVPLVANGVDTATAARRLTELGVRLGAGAHFGAPVDPETAGRLISAGHC
jgi:diguanylate cyclase (GGDEF)-like protein/PAS domain S-box-containing protein